MKRLVLGMLAAGALGAVPAATSAQLVGPVYPPPDGVSFSAAGSALTGSGQTRTYSSLTPGSFDALFWGFSNVVSPYMDPDGGGPCCGIVPSMAFGGFTGPGVGFFVSTTPLFAFGGVPTPGPTTFLSFQFQATGTPVGGPSPGLGILAPVPAPACASGDPLLGCSYTGFPVAVDVTGMTDFQVWLRYSVGCPLMTCMALGDYYDSFPGKPAGAILKTSTAGGFWYDEYTPPPTTVPEPVTMTLLGTGLAGIAAARRRRKSAKE